jgi:hypothetical protein
LAAGGLRYYECLNVEAPYEKLVTLSRTIGLDVALTKPCQKAHQDFGSQTNQTPCSVEAPLRSVTGFMLA